MAEITPGQKIDLLAEIRMLLPDAEYAPSESWHGTSPIDFQDSCGCYSEYTTEPCSFDVTVAGTLPKSDEDQWDLRQAIESRVTRWVHNSLSWSGCRCCNHADEGGEYEEPGYIWVNAHIFQKKDATEAANG